VVQSTCTRAIKRLRGAFSDQETTADGDSVLDDLMELANEIQRALHEFDSTSNHAVLRQYRRVDPSGRASPISTEDNPDLFLSGSDNEHVFLVYLYANSFVLVALANLLY
jgi:hypothetical protein